jgi:acyl carrier protein
MRLEAVARAIRGSSEAARELTILPGSHLVEDIGLDSLDLVSVVMQLQDDMQVEIDLDSVGTLARVSDLMDQLDCALARKAA